MTDFVTDKEEFVKYKSRFFQLFVNDDFENNPFFSDFKYFLSFEFDFIHNKSFFEGLKNFLKSIGYKTVTFYTIDPSPEDYFYKHFNKFSVFEININAPDKELNDIMMKDPGNSSADALAINSNEISWFSNSNEWAIIGSRDWEIAVVGFTNEKIKQNFIDSFSEDAQTMFTSMKTQVDALDEMLNFNDKIKAEYTKLVESYKNR